MKHSHLTVQVNENVKLIIQLFPPFLKKKFNGKF